MHQLGDKELRGLVIEETGEGNESNVVTLVVSCIKAIKQFAKNPEAVTEKPVDAPPTNLAIPVDQQRSRQEQPERPEQVRMNLGYTINLNLPPTSDVAVFNAIFKSLKEHLLTGHS
jgi:hypothetical protein